MYYITIIYENNKTNVSMGHGWPYHTKLVSKLQRLQIQYKIKAP